MPSVCANGINVIGHGTNILLPNVCDIPYPLTGVLFACVIYIFIMIIEHARVTKTTDDRTATWRFVDMDGAFAAIGDNRKIIPCRDIDHMRSVYKRFTSPKYGFVHV